MSSSHNYESTLTLINSRVASRTDIVKIESEPSESPIGIQKDADVNHSNEEFWWETNGTDSCDVTTVDDQSLLNSGTEIPPSDSFRFSLHQCSEERMRRPHQSYMCSISQLLQELVNSTSLRCGKEKMISEDKRSSVDWLLQSVRFFMYELMEQPSSFVQEYLKVSLTSSCSQRSPVEENFSPLALLSEMKREITSIRAGRYSSRNDEGLVKRQFNLRNGDNLHCGVGALVEEEVSFSLQTYFHSCIGPLIWLWLLVVFEKQSMKRNDSSHSFSFSTAVQSLTNGFQKLLSTEALRSACLFPVSGAKESDVEHHRFLHFLRHVHTQGCLSFCTLEWNSMMGGDNRLAFQNQKTLIKSSPGTLVSSFSSLCVGVTDLILSYVVIAFKRILHECTRKPLWESLIPPFSSDAKHLSSTPSLQKADSSFLFFSSTFSSSRLSHRRKAIEENVVEPLVNELWLTLMYFTSFFGSSSMLYEREYDRLGLKDSVPKKASDVIRRIIAEMKAREKNENENEMHGHFQRQDDSTVSSGGQKVPSPACPPPTSGGGSSACHERESSLLPMVLKVIFPTACAALQRYHNEVVSLYRTLEQYHPSFSSGSVEKSKAQVVARAPPPSAVSSLLDHLQERKVLLEAISSSLVSSAVLDIGMTESMWWFVKALIIHLQVEWTKSEKCAMPFTDDRNVSSPCSWKFSTATLSPYVATFSEALDRSATSDSRSGRRCPAGDTMGEMQKKDWIQRVSNIEVVCRRHLLFKGMNQFLHQLDERLEQYQRHRQYLLPLTLALIEKDKQCRLDALLFSRESGGTPAGEEARTLPSMNVGLHPRMAPSSRSFSSSNSHHPPPPPHVEERPQVRLSASLLPPLTAVSDRIRHMFHHVYHSFFLSQHLTWEDVIRVHNTRQNRRFFWDCLGASHLTRLFLTSLSSPLSSSSSSCGAVSLASPFFFSFPSAFGKDHHPSMGTPESGVECVLAAVHHILSDNGVPGGPSLSQLFETCCTAAETKGRHASHMHVENETVWETPPHAQVPQETTHLSLWLSRMWTVVEDCYHHVTMLQPTTEGVRASHGSSSTGFPLSSKRNVAQKNRVGTGFMPSTISVDLSKTSIEKISPHALSAGPPHRSMQTHVGATDCQILPSSFCTDLLSHPPHSPEAFCEGLDAALRRSSRYIGAMEGVSDHWCGTVLGAAGESPHTYLPCTSVHVSSAAQTFLHGVRSQPHLLDLTVPPRATVPPSCQSSLPSSAPLPRCSRRTNEKEPTGVGDAPEWMLYHSHHHFLSAVFYLIYHPSCFVALADHLGRPHQRHLRRVLSSLKALLLPAPPRPRDTASSSARSSSVLPTPSCAILPSPVPSEEDEQARWWPLEVAWCTLMQKTHPGPVFENRPPHDTEEKWPGEEEEVLPTACNTRDESGAKVVSSAGCGLAPPLTTTQAPKGENHEEWSGLDRIGGSEAEERKPVPPPTTPPTEMGEKEKEMEERGEEKEKKKVEAEEEVEDGEWWNFHGCEIEEEEHSRGASLGSSHCPQKCGEAIDEAKREVWKDASMVTKRGTTGGVLPCSGVVAALLGQDTYATFFLLHCFLSFLPSVETSGSESWSSLEKRSTEKQASLVVKHQVEIMNTLILPLLVRVTTPLPQLLSSHGIPSSFSSPLDFLPETASRSPAPGPSHPKPSSASLCTSSSSSPSVPMPPFSTTFLLLCLRASGVLQLPWSVGETLLVLHRFQRLGHYVLLSQKRAQDKHARRLSSPLRARAFPSISSSACVSDAISHTSEDPLDGRHAARKRTRPWMNAVEGEFPQPPSPCRPPSPSSCRIDPSGPLLPPTHTASFPSLRWVLQRKSQARILRQLGWRCVLPEDAHEEEEAPPDAHASGLAQGGPSRPLSDPHSAFYPPTPSSRTRVDDALLHRIDQWNALENPFLWAALHAKAEKQSGRLLPVTDEEEEEMEGEDPYEDRTYPHTKEEEEGDRMLSFLETEETAPEAMAMRRTPSWLPRGATSKERVAWKGYYRQLLTTLDSGVHPFTHWVFESAQLLSAAASTTLVPPSPCGVLLVMSLYRSIAAVFLERRKDWVESCQEKEKEEAQWGNSGVGGGGGGPYAGSRAALSMKGVGGLGVRGLAVEESQASPLPPLCSVEDLTILGVHITVLHRMLFTFNCQSFLPTLFFSTSGGGGGGEGRKAERERGGGPSAVRPTASHVKKDGDETADVGVWAWERRPFTAEAPHPTDPHSLSGGVPVEGGTEVVQDEVDPVHVDPSASVVGTTFSAHAMRYVTARRAVHRAHDGELLCHALEDMDPPDGEGEAWEGVPDGSRTASWGPPSGEDRLPTVPPVASTHTKTPSHGEESGKGNLTRRIASASFPSTSKNGPFSLFQLWLAYVEHFCRVILPPAAEEDGQSIFLLPSSQRGSPVATPLSSRCFVSTSKRSTTASPSRPARQHGAPHAPHDRGEGCGMEEEKSSTPLMVEREGWRAVAWPTPGAAYPPTASSPSSSSFSTSSTLSMPTQIRILLGEALADLVVAVLDEASSLPPTVLNHDTRVGEEEGRKRGSHPPCCFPPAPPLASHAFAFPPPPTDLPCTTGDGVGWERRSSSSRFAGLLSLAEGHMRLCHVFGVSSFHSHAAPSECGGRAASGYLLEEIEVEPFSAETSGKDAWVPHRHTPTKGLDTMRGPSTGERESVRPPPPSTGGPKKGKSDDETNSEWEALQTACQVIPRMVLMELCHSVLLPTTVSSSVWDSFHMPYGVYTQPESMPDDWTGERKETKRDGQGSSHLDPSSSSFFSDGSLRVHSNPDEAKKPHACASPTHHNARPLFQCYEEASHACWLGLHGLVSFLRRLESRILPGTVEDRSIGIALSRLWELADILTLERDVVK